MKFRNIIFDFDGTLVDSKHDIASAQLWALEGIGAQGFSASDLFPHIGKTLEETFSTVLPSFMHEKIPEAARLYSEYFPSRSLVTTRLYPGVLDTLAALQRDGRLMAIASVKKGPGIRRATDHFGITPFFVQLQGSEGIPPKPDPRSIEKILTDQQWHSDKTLMVGDTDKDILAGKNAHISTCAVTYGSLPESDLRQFHPDFVISEFHDILSIV